MIKNTIIKQQLQARRSELITLLSMLESSSGSHPAGNLRISSSHGKVQFFQIDKSNNDFPAHGRYLHSDEEKLISHLAQKDYDLQFQKALKEELFACEKALSLIPDEELDELFNKQHPARQARITPWILTDQQFLEEWLKSVLHSRK